MSHIQIMISVQASFLAMIGLGINIAHLRIEKNKIIHTCYIEGDEESDPRANSMR